MIRSSTLLKLGLFTLSLLLVSTISAKKVICIDDNGNANDGFLNGHEGWERQEAGPDDIIVKGGSLTDCMAQLEDGDVLVIVAHGVNGGEGFKWGGQVYWGFGDGDDEMPVPDGFDETTVHIKFCSCWSARDPDGPGTDTPLTDKLKGKAGPGSTAEGFNDLSQSRTCWTWTGGTAATCKAVGDSLAKNTEWIKKPPHNRPDAPAANDKACAQAIADAIAPGITIGITYYAPQNVVDPDEVENVEEEEETADEGGSSGGCGCADDCGLYKSMSPDAINPPDVDTPFNFPFPSGLWRQNELLVFPLETGNVWLRNLRLLDELGQSIPIGGTDPIIFSIAPQAFAEVSTDGGQSWAPVFGSAFMNGQATPIANTGPNAYYDVIIGFSQVAFGPSSIPGFSLNLEPTNPATGVTSVIPVAPGQFAVDSFFDIWYTIQSDDGFVAGACGSARMYLRCSAGSEGCTNMDSPGFDACAIFDDGSCSAAIAGCTYAAASNYNPNATSENGSCIFHGCTDPTATNYDPLANSDNGLCNVSCECIGDNNDDNVINTADLLIVLAVFGMWCEECFE